jgi:hypothetical protein
LIETPEERKADEAKSSTTNNDDSLQPTETILCVLVPADTSQPLQELSFQLPQNKSSTQQQQEPSYMGGGGDALIKHLKPLFSTQSDKVDLALFQQTNSSSSNQSTTIGMSSDALPQVSEAALKQVAQEGQVETFSLLHAIPSNKFVGVNLYLDEIGLLKRLPLNTRASNYAKAAGFDPAPQFYGNVVLSRIQKKNGIIVQHVSFTLGKDTTMDAAWLQKAAMENLEYQMEMNRLTGRGGETQAGVAGGEGVAKAEDGYTWTQTEEELELVVSLPTDAISKDIQVQFRPQCVVVRCQKEVVILLDLFERVDVDGCTWTLDKQKEERTLVVTMEKMEAALWPRILH